MLGVFLLVHILKDLQTDLAAWYFHSTPVWLIVMGLASLLFFRKNNQMKKEGIEVKEKFLKLPEE